MQTIYESTSNLERWKYRSRLILFQDVGTFVITGVRILCSQIYYYTAFSLSHSHVYSFSNIHHTNHFNKQPPWFMLAGKIRNIFYIVRITYDNFSPIRLFALFLIRVCVINRPYRTAAFFFLFVTSSKLWYSHSKYNFPNTPLYTR